MDFRDQAAYAEINQCRMVLKERRYVKISPPEEERCWRRIRQCVELALVRHAEYSRCRGHQLPQRVDRLAMNEDERVIAELYMPFVFSIVRKMWWPAVSFLDLFQEGTIGLMRAVRRYDYRRGIKFTTFAQLWVCQEIGRYLDIHLRTIRIPSHILLEARRRRRATDETALEIPHSVSSGDYRENDEEEWMTADGDSSHSPENIFSKKEWYLCLYHAVAALKDRDRSIIELRYGLHGADTHTFQEVGSCFSITRAGAQFIERRALSALSEDKKLKELFGIH